MHRFQFNGDKFIIKLVIFMAHNVLLLMILGIMRVIEVVFIKVMFVILILECLHLSQVSMTAVFLLL